MNIRETVDNFNEVKSQIAKELNADLNDLTELTYLKYTEDTFNGYVYSSTVEEWLKMVTPLYV